MGCVSKASWTRLRAATIECRMKISLQLSFKSKEKPGSKKEREETSASHAFFEFMSPLKPVLFQKYLRKHSFFFHLRYPSELSASISSSNSAAHSSGLFLSEITGIFIKVSIFSGAPRPYLSFCGFKNSCKHSGIGNISISCHFCQVPVPAPSRVRVYLKTLPLPGGSRRVGSI